MQFSFCDNTLSWNGFKPAKILSSERKTSHTIQILQNHCHVCGRELAKSILNLTTYLHCRQTGPSPALPCPTYLFQLSCMPAYNRQWLIVTWVTSTAGQCSVIVTVGLWQVVAYYHKLCVNCASGLRCHTAHSRSCMPYYFTGTISPPWLFGAHQPKLHHKWFSTLSVVLYTRYELKPWKSDWSFWFISSKSLYVPRHTVTVFCVVYWDRKCYG